jgi:hypothetical protein
MTDARLPERWLNDRRFLRLSDAAHRLYVHTLMWSVANRSDGVVYDDDLALMPSVDIARVGELDKAELWQRDGDRWLILDFPMTQTSRDDLVVLENNRRREREKKARQRAEQSESSPVPGDVPGEVLRDTPRTGQGQGASTEGELSVTSAVGKKACRDCGRPNPWGAIPAREGGVRCRDCNVIAQRNSRAVWDA